MGRPKKIKAIEEEVKQVGRPSSYKEHYAQQVYKLCLLGAKDTDIASFFEVCEATINNWKIEFPDFLESIRNGKKISDMEVADALYKTTQDRIVIEQQAIKCKSVFYNEEGKRVEEEVIKIVDVEKTIPADFRSQSFWLKNRKSDVWRDKQEVEHSGNVGTVNLSDLTTEELIERAKAIKKLNE